jgi:cytidine deaminase
MDIKNFNFQYTEFESSKELESADSILLAKAKEAIAGSYSPYSQFAVGAAVRLANGQIVKGSNQENAAYPSGLCAERVALFSASSQYPEVAIEAIAIAAKPLGEDSDAAIVPCGACRQAMLEYEHLSQKPMKVFMHGESSTIRFFHSAADLLPFNFIADHLKK